MQNKTDEGEGGACWLSPSWLISLRAERHQDAWTSCYEHVTCCVFFLFPLCLADRCLMDVIAPVATGHGSLSSDSFISEGSITSRIALCSDFVLSECLPSCALHWVCPQQLLLWRTEGTRLPREGEFNQPDLTNALALPQSLLEVTFPCVVSTL